MGSRSLSRRISRDFPLCDVESWMAQHATAAATVNRSTEVKQGPPWNQTRFQLGDPLPASAHAVSVSLPCWRHIIGYEEEEPEVMARISTGYPRFLIHPFVRELARHLGKGQPCLPFPSGRVAMLCAQFICRTSRAKVDIVADGQIHGVVTSEVGKIALNSFWQHTGMIVTSRQAEAHLAGSSTKPQDRALFDSLRRQLADLYDCAESDVFLQPTGMASHFAALRAVTRRQPNRLTAQIGFPNSDTLKLQQKLGCGAILLHRLENLGRDLDETLRRQVLAAGFCEIPGNPLLGSADLRVVSPLLRKRGVPLVADDVVATPANVDLTGHADLIATSLTKFIAGTADVMGGALICNPRSPFHRQLKLIVQAQHEELLWAEDAAILDAQARGFTERMTQHNRNGSLIAQRLQDHPAVERVWYPKWEFNEAYEAVRRPNGGWGALLSFVVKNAATKAPAIYDRMPICKGPSFGAAFTLACPVPILAHATELDWAEACGVPRHLIRISVGLEDVEDLWRRLNQALVGN